MSRLIENDEEVGTFASIANDCIFHLLLQYCPSHVDRVTTKNESELLEYSWSIYRSSFFVYISKDKEMMRWGMNRLTKSPFPYDQVADDAKYTFFRLLMSRKA